MAAPNPQIESPADRDARIRRKNRKMIPWIVAACIAPFLVLALLMLAILGPALLKVHQIMRDTEDRPAAGQSEFRTDRHRGKTTAFLARGQAPVSGLVAMPTGRDKISDASYAA